MAMRRRAEPARVVERVVETTACPTTVFPTATFGACPTVSPFAACPTVSPFAACPTVSPFAACPTVAPQAAPIVQVLPQVQAQPVVPTIAPIAVNPLAQTMPGQQLLQIIPQPNGTLLVVDRTTGSIVTNITCN